MNLINIDSPQYEVVISMIDQSRNTAIWVELGMFRAFMFALRKVKEYCFVCEVKLVEHEGYLPVRVFRVELDEKIGLGDCTIR